MRRPGTFLPPAPRVPGEAPLDSTRRLRRDSAILLCLAVIGAAVTIAFGIWMADAIPSASIGAPTLAP